jgi:hypothetical protein
MLVGRIGLALVGATAIATFVAVPANAVDTVVLFTTTGGALNITTPVSAILAGGTNSGGTLSGKLGTVTVTDSRGTAAGWLASVFSTGFTTTTGGGVPNNYATYTPGPNAGTVAPGTPGISAGVAGSPGVSGRAALIAYAYSNVTAGGNSVSWNPTVTVVPLLSTVVTGATYSGTVTHQVV